MVPDPVASPPVTNVNMDNTGRFAFVEFRTEEMATRALEMDKVVELCGRAMNIGRPKGYVPLPPGATTHQLPQPAAQPQPTVVVAGQPTACLLLSNLLPAGHLRGEEDRQIVSGAREAARRPACRSPGHQVAACSEALLAVLCLLRTLCACLTSRPAACPPRSCRARCRRRRRGTVR
jgi:hypothetical protein